MKKTFFVKKLAACLLLLAMLTGITACGGKKKTDVSPTDVSPEIANLVGTWYEDGLSVLDPRTLTVSEDGSYTLVYKGGGASYGTVKAEYEEHPDGTKSLWYNFYEEDGTFWAGFAADESDPVPGEIYSGQDGEMHFLREGYVRTAAEDYLGVWACGRITVAITKEKKYYDVNVSWASSAAEYDRWNYHCQFDEVTGTLICTSGATHVNSVVSESGEEKVKVLYQDGSGSFQLKNGVLHWYDDQDGTGDGLDLLKDSVG